MLRQHCMFLASVLSITVLICSCQNVRPPMQDDPEARELFRLAEQNRTQDGFITFVELEDIFEDFDLDGDGSITETEFLSVWKSKDLGTADRAKTLFHHADTDSNGDISRDPDLPRVFYYFDRNGDSKVSEAEFVVVWMSLSL